MVTLRKIKEFDDGTANYTFSSDDQFLKFYIEKTGNKTPTTQQLGEFFKNLVFDAVGESYTENPPFNTKKQNI